VVAILDRKEPGPEGQGCWREDEPVPQALTTIHICICVQIQILGIHISMARYQACPVHLHTYTQPNAHTRIRTHIHTIKLPHTYWYTTSGGGSRSKLVSSVRKRFGARQRHPLHDYLYVYICVYICTHTLLVTVLCEILSIRCICHTNTCATTLSLAHVLLYQKHPYYYRYCVTHEMQVLNTRFKKFIPMNIIVTYIEYVKVFETIKTQKQIPWKEIFPESVF